MSSQVGRAEEKKEVEESGSRSLFAILFSPFTDSLDLRVLALVSKLVRVWFGATKQSRTYARPDSAFSPRVSFFVRFLTISPTQWFLHLSFCCSQLRTGKCIVQGWLLLFSAIVARLALYVSSIVRYISTGYLSTLYIYLNSMLNLSSLTCLLELCTFCS